MVKARAAPGRGEWKRTRIFSVYSKAKGWLAKVGKGSIGPKRSRAENRAWDRNNQTHWRESLEVKV